MGGDASPTTGVIPASDASAKDTDKPLEKGGDGDCSNGPVQNRKCTDILCCVAFLAHWLAFIVVMGMALERGEPSRLIAPRDFKGAHCGEEVNWNPWNEVTTMR